MTRISARLSRKKLSGDLVRVQRIDFERLIRTLGTFPSLEMVGLHKEARKNYLDTFIQELIERNIKKCYLVY
jgi:hypothetical protein